MSSPSSIDLGIARFNIPTRLDSSKPHVFRIIKQIRPSELHWHCIIHFQVGPFMKSVGMPIVDVVVIQRYTAVIRPMKNVT